MASYYLSAFFYGGKRLVAESGRNNKRSAARAIAQYLNSHNACSWHTYTISEVYMTLIPFSSAEIARYGVSRCRFILY